MENQVNVDIESNAEIVTKKCAKFLNWNFFLQFLIFLLSVIGAICVSLQENKGFVLWLFSNFISIGYFFYQKQYPLFLQQIVFTVTTILGIWYNWSSIITF